MPPRRRRRPARQQSRAAAGRGLACMEAVSARPPPSTPPRCSPAGLNPTPCGPPAPRSAGPRPAAPWRARTAPAQRRRRGRWMRRPRPGGCGREPAAWDGVGTLLPPTGCLPSSPACLPLGLPPRCSGAWAAATRRPRLHAGTQLGAAPTHRMIRWRENLAAVLESSSYTQLCCISWECIRCRIGRQAEQRECAAALAGTRAVAGKQQGRPARADASPWQQAGRRARGHVSPPAAPVQTAAAAPRPSAPPGRPPLPAHPARDWRQCCTPDLRQVRGGRWLKVIRVQARGCRGARAAAEAVAGARPGAMQGGHSRCDAAIGASAARRCRQPPGLAPKYRWQGRPARMIS